MRIARVLLISLLAAATTVALPAASVLYFLHTDSGIDLAGQPDDAPKRAAGLILFVVLPMAFALAAVYFPVVSWLLRKVHRVTFAPYAVIALALAFLLTASMVLIGRESPSRYWPGPELFNGLLMLASLMAGSVVWWLFTRPGRAA
jgi:hypothetical protein